MSVLANSGLGDSALGMSNGMLDGKPFTLSADLIKNLAKQLTLNYARLFDCINWKMRWFQLAQPEYDVMGLCSQAAGVLSNIVWGSKFNITVRNNDKVNQLIQDHIMGRCNLVNNLRKHYFLHLLLGNMSTFVQRDSYGLPIIKYTNGLCTLPLAYNESQVTKIANLGFDYLDNDQYCIVTIDDKYSREFQLYKINGGTMVTSVYYGQPLWYQIMGALEPRIEQPLGELGHAGAQWWNTPNPHPRWMETPYTQGIMWLITDYFLVLRTYMELNKEFRWKTLRVFINKYLLDQGFIQNFGFNPNDPFTPSGTSAPGPTLYPPVNNGMWPNTDSFWDPYNMVINFFQNYHESKDPLSQDIFVKTTMPEDKFFEVMDPAIRDTSFFNKMDFELARLGKAYKLGPNFFRVLVGEKQSATQYLQGDRDLLNFVETCESEAKFPLVGIVLKFCDYWVQDGTLAPKEVPTKFTDFEFSWDHRVLLDEKEDRNFWLQAGTAGLVSRENVLRHTTTMTEDQIALNTIELLANPIEGQMMTREHDAMHEMREGAYGTLGRSFGNAAINSPTKGRSAGTQNKGAK